MALCSMGSIVSVHVDAGQDIIDLIYDDIEIKYGRRLTRLPLRHISIFDDGGDGNLYEIDKHIFEIRDGMFATPMDDRAYLIEIHNVKPLQPVDISVYYLR